MKTLVLTFVGGPVDGRTIAHPGPVAPPEFEVSVTSCPGSVIRIGDLAREEPPPVTHETFLYVRASDEPTAGTIYRYVPKGSRLP